MHIRLVKLFTFKNARERTRRRPACRWGPLRIHTCNRIRPPNLYSMYMHNNKFINIIYIYIYIHGQFSRMHRLVGLLYEISLWLIIHFKRIKKLHKVSLKCIWINIPLAINLNILELDINN